MSTKKNTIKNIGKSGNSKLSTGNIYRYFLFTPYQLIPVLVFTGLLTWLFLRIDSRSDSVSKALISFLPMAVFLTIIFSLFFIKLFKKSKN